MIARMHPTGTPHHAQADAEADEAVARVRLLCDQLIAELSNTDRVRQQLLASQQEANREKQERYDAERKLSTAESKLNAIAVELQRISGSFVCGSEVLARGRRGY